MAKFRFRIYDPKTRKERKGKIDAKDIETARCQLVARGMQVQALTSELEFRAEKTSVWSMAQGSSRLNYQPTLLERISAVKITSAASKLVLGCLILLGCLIFYSQWSGLSGKGAKENPRQDIAIEIKGRLSEAPPSDTTIRIRFPEIPYSQERGLEGCLTEGSSFVLKIAFATPHAPLYCDIELQSYGFEPIVVRRARLSGTPLSADLGTMNLSRKR